jgi:hypothetical protein
VIRPEPCFNCGARGSCRHREVEDVALQPLVVREDGRRTHAHSLWGSKGNPAGKSRQRIIEAMKARLR